MKSLPVWEEWIEIPIFRAVIPLGVRLFPYGKSGLKSAHWEAENMLTGLFPYGKSGLKSASHGLAQCVHVSSRMGRVD